jgi:hypothetical protein
VRDQVGHALSLVTLRVQIVAVHFKEAELASVLQQKRRATDRLPEEFVKIHTESIRHLGPAQHVPVGGRKQQGTAIGGIDVHRSRHCALVRGSAANRVSLRRLAVTITGLRPILLHNPAGMAAPSTGKTVIPACGVGDHPLPINRINGKPCF